MKKIVSKETTPDYFLNNLLFDFKEYRKKNKISKSEAFLYKQIAFKWYELNRPEQFKMTASEVLEDIPFAENEQKNFKMNFNRVRDGLVKKGLIAYKKSSNPYVTGYINLLCINSNYIQFYAFKTNEKRLF